MSNSVQLLVYDLSRGMATMMSQSILGTRIDGIWHTGIIVSILNITICISISNITIYLYLLGVWKRILFWWWNPM
jgi:hypothetical protein